MSAEMRKLTQTTLHAFWIDCWMDMTTDSDLDREVGWASDSTLYTHLVMRHIFLASSIASVPGGITEVKTDIFVTSFGPVSDVNMVRREKLPG